MNTKRVQKQLQRHEGYRKLPYLDTEGVLTVGYGRNLDVNGVSRPEARFMLANDVRKAYAELRQKVPFYGQLNDVRQEVLVNMIVNLGWPRLRGFKKMFAALELAVSSGDEDHFLTVKLEMLDSRWRTQVKGRALELGDLMQSGMVDAD